MGVFARMMLGLVQADATYLRAHQTASSLRLKKRGRLIRRTKGGLNTKLHVLTDQNGKPLRAFLTTGQVSGYTGAASLLVF